MNTYTHTDCDFPADAAPVVEFKDPRAFFFFYFTPLVYVELSILFSTDSLFLFPFHWCSGFYYILPLFCPANFPLSLAIFVIIPSLRFSPGPDGFLSSSTSILRSTVVEMSVEVWSHKIEGSKKKVRRTGIKRWRRREKTTLRDFELASRAWEINCHIEFTGANLPTETRTRRTDDFHGHTKNGLAISNLQLK